MKERIYFTQKLDTRTGVKYWIGYIRVEGSRVPMQRRLARVEELEKLPKDERIKILTEKYSVLRASLEMRDPQQLGELFEKFIEYKKSLNVRPSTITLYHYSLRKFIEICAGVRINNINQSHVQKYRSYLLSVNSPSSTNIKLRNLKSFINWLYDARLIRHRVKVEMTKAPRPKSEILSDNEIKTLFDYLSSQTGIFSVALYRFALLAAYTGARRDEIVYLENSSFDFDQNLILVRTNEFFNIKENCAFKFIPMHLELKKKLLGLNLKGRFYIGDAADGGPIYKPHSLTKAFRRIFRNLGFSESVKPSHFWRSKLATRMINDLKLPMDMAAAILNHSSVQTTSKHYAKYDQETLLSAINQIPPFQN